MVKSSEIEVGKPLVRFDGLVHQVQVQSVSGPNDERRTGQLLAAPTTELLQCGAVAERIKRP